MTGPQPVRTRFDGSDVDVPCEEGRTVLFSALHAGWDLPYECASGGCGSCTVQLLSGQVHCLWPEATGLSERARRRGDRVLACQSVPLADCVVRLPGGPPRPAAGTAPPAARRTAAVVDAVRPVTADLVEVVLAAADPVPYLAGQFVLVELPDGARRAYSMSRRPGERPDRIEVLVRRVPGGAVSGRLAVPGAEVVVEGPYGRAHAQSPADRPVLCVGGGSGLGPVLAVAEQALADAADRPVVLYHGARTPDDVALPDRLAALAGRGARVEVATDSGDPDADGADAVTDGVRRRTGRVVDVLAADLAADGVADGADVYLAGPPPMVDAFVAAFVRTGAVPADRVFFDRFL